METWTKHEQFRQELKQEICGAWLENKILNNRKLLRVSFLRAFELQLENKFMDGVCKRLRLRCAKDYRESLPRHMATFLLKGQAHRYNHPETDELIQLGTLLGLHKIRLSAEDL